MSTADKRTASQRIEDLERAVMAIYQATNNMARDNSLIKNALKLMDNKIEAIMKASTNGEPLSTEVISRIMKENELEELKERVVNMVNQGFLAPLEAIEDGAFVVGSEDEPDAADGTPGKTIHARLQFSLNTLDKEVQEKLKGAKVGETVKFKDDALVFKVKEIYKIVNPTPVAPETAPAPVAEVAPVAAEGSAAAEQSSSDANANANAPEAASSGQSSGN